MVDCDIELLTKTSPFLPIDHNIIEIACMDTEYEDDCWRISFILKLHYDWIKHVLIEHF